MQINWTPGPPPCEEGKSWIVESEAGTLCRMKWNGSRRLFVGEVTKHFFLQGNEIIRHAPYDPMPEPLQPWRRFTRMTDQAALLVDNELLQKRVDELESYLKDVIEKSAVFFDSPDDAKVYPNASSKLIDSVDDALACLLKNTTVKMQETRE